MLLDFTREAGTTLFSGCNNGIRSREKILVDSSLDKLEVKALRGQLITSSFFLGCAQEGLYSGKVVLHPDVSRYCKDELLRAIRRCGKTNIEVTFMENFVVEKSFSEALSALESGEALFIQRAGWNGAGLRVKLQRPDAHSKMTMPYAYIVYPDNHAVYPGAHCPWVASQSDLFAKDWQWAPNISE